MSTADLAPPCKGKTAITDHPMIELGKCEHRVSGSVRGYRVVACPECGVTGHQGPISFACGRGIRYVALTAENCIGLRWKADREASNGN